MKEVVQYLKEHFQRRGNGLTQLLLLHALAFFGLLVSQIVQRFTGWTLYDTLIHYTQLPGLGKAFLARFWTLGTYCFVHQKLHNLVVNMLYLYLFGRIVTYLLGSQHLVKIYLLGTLVGGAAFVLLYNLWPQAAAVATLYAGVLQGAEPPLYAVLGGAATFAPNLPMFVLPGLTVRLKHVAYIFLLWPVRDLAQGDAPAGMAQLGGMLAGYLYVYFLQQDKGAWPKRTFTKLTQGLRRPFSTQAMSVRRRQRERAKSVDAILDKIAQSGYESLSDEEKRKLFHQGS